MATRDELPPRAADWDGGWDAHRRRQLEGWLLATPAQRLAWLEEMIAFAYQAGARRFERKK